MKQRLKIEQESVLNELMKERVEIDKIDEMLIYLLGKRMDKSLEVGKLKKNNDVKVCDPCREQEILINVGKSKYGEQMQDIFYKILQESKRLQEKD